jgi:alcohol dehydrogenase (cytochrome c)
MLIDGEFGGKQRKLLAQANRNGYFFLLDRTNGSHLLTAPFVQTNWSKGIDSQGIPIENTTKEPTRDGTLVSPSSGGATNWFPPSFSPDTGLFYVNASQNYSVFYLTAEGKAEGFAGRDNGLPGDQGFTLAIDYKTGKVCWRHEGDSNAGLLSTAGQVLFTGDSSGHLMALDPRDGHAVWHVNTGQYVGNGPMTYELDKRQYVVFGAGDSLYAFSLPE